MADIITLNADEKDIYKVVAAVRQLAERFQPSEDTASGALQAANNLDDLDDAPTARTNLGLGSSATHAEGDFFQVSNNLSEGTAATKRTNLGLAYGLQTIWVPAAGMVGYVGAAPGQTTYSSGSFHAITWDFDQTTLEAVVFQITMPKSWDKGNIFFLPYWTASGSPSGTVAWNFFAEAISDNEALSASIPNHVDSNDTFQNADRLHIGPISSGFTPDGSPANDDLLLVAINRSPAFDTLNADARLIGVKILYTVSAGNDS